MYHIERYLEQRDIYVNDFKDYTVDRMQEYCHWLPGHDHRPVDNNPGTPPSASYQPQFAPSGSGTPTSASTSTTEPEQPRDQSRF